MAKSKSVEHKIRLISSIHRKLSTDQEIKPVEISDDIESLFGDSHIRRGLEKAAAELETGAHEIKVHILKAFLSQLQSYGFLGQDVNYVDWCSGRGELAYSLAHLLGAEVTRVDKKFRRKNFIEELFPCTREYEIPELRLDLTKTDYDRDTVQVPENPKGRVAYVGIHCCGSLTDLVGKIAKSQKRQPDFIGVLPCHHDKMDFGLSISASGINFSEKTFNLLVRAVADLQKKDGYHPVARKAMEIIDRYRAENLVHLGYEAKVVKLYPSSVSPFNHMVVGFRN